MNKYLPTIGADPEAFVFDTEKGIPVHAGGLIPGTKDSPHTVKHGAIQVDGVAVEFNIDPVQTAEEFIHNIESVKQQLTQYLKDVNKNLELRFTDTVQFTPKYFETIPKKDLVVGCDPDFFIRNVSHFEAAVVPTFPKGVRFAGGHLHVGNIFYENEDSVSKETKQKYMVFCFARHGYLCNNYYTSKISSKEVNPDSLGHSFSNIRKTGYTPRTYHGYGQPGRFRPKSYGFEYRSTGNWWVAAPKLQQAIFEEMFQYTIRIQEHFSMAKLNSPNVESIIPPRPAELQQLIGS